MFRRLLARHATPTRSAHRLANSTPATSRRRPSRPRRPPPGGPRFNLIAASTRDVLALHALHGSSMDTIGIGAMWTTLRKRALKEVLNGWLRTPEFGRAVGPMCKQTEQMIRENRLCSRSLANTMHSIASLQQISSSQPWDPLWSCALPLVLRRVEDFNRQELANITWAFITAHRATPELLAALARRVEAEANDFNKIEVVLLSCSFARTSFRQPGLFKALAISAEAKVDQLTTSEIARLAWAHARSGYARTSSASLMCKIVDVAIEQLRAFEPRSLGALAWAYAHLGPPYPLPLFDAIARTLLDRKARSARAGDVANLLWSFARIGEPHPLLFEALSRTALRRAAVLNEHQISMICWSLATARCRSDLVVELFLTLAQQEATHTMAGFTTQGLSNVAWAFAKLEISAAHTFQAISEQVALRLDSFKPQELANLCWAFATSKQPLPAGFEGQVISRLGHFRPQELVAIAWAFTHLSHEDLQLFGSIADEVHLRLDADPRQFSESEAASLAKTFSIAADLYGASAMPAVATAFARCSALHGRRVSGHQHLHLLKTGDATARANGGTTDNSGREHEKLLGECGQVAREECDGPAPRALLNSLSPTPGHLVAGAAHERTASVLKRLELQEDAAFSRPALLLAVEELARIGALPASSLSPTHSSVLDAELASPAGTNEATEASMVPIDATKAEDKLAAALAEVRSAKVAVQHAKARADELREASRKAGTAAKAAQLAAKRGEEQNNAVVEDRLLQKQIARFEAAQRAARAAAAEYAEWTVAQTRVVSVASAGVATASIDRNNNVGNGASNEKRVGDGHLNVSASGLSGAGAHTGDASGDRRRWEFLVRTLGQAAQPEDVKAMVEPWMPINGAAHRLARGAEVSSCSPPREGTCSDGSSEEVGGQ
mmetsp:Transcript_22652/g.69176  ORF Transcript_22652/g.69176 Transcript_22652/m.69176 type:complete len:900 (+) Transcript_22652:100-2799(+)